MKKEELTAAMNEEYIRVITELLPKCDDIEILDIIRQLLIKTT